MSEHSFAACPLGQCPSGQWYDNGSSPKVAAGVGSSLEASTSDSALLHYTRGQSWVRAKFPIFLTRLRIRRLFAPLMLRVLKVSSNPVFSVRVPLESASGVAKPDGDMIEPGLKVTDAPLTVVVAL